MRILRIIAASTAAMGALLSAAMAQQDMNGMITKIDRLTGTVAIQQTQSGTVGANAGGPVEEYKVQDRGSLEAFHAGDKVKFTITESGGSKTVTKLQKP